ncbi:flagellar hook-associated protein FlgL [Candidatus Latescibacterota bacterium]
MRVTDTILQNNLLSNLNFSSERLYEAETKVLTNKRVNKPSDNPVDAMTSMNIRTKIEEINQFQRNIGRAKIMLENTESQTTQLADIFQRLSTLTVQGASDSYGASDKLSIASEVNQLVEQIFNIANSRSESSYIYGGTSNDVAPYQATFNADGEIASVGTTGSSGDIQNMIGDRIKIKINVNGEDLFEKNENLFEIAIKIRDDLRANDSTSLNVDLGKLHDSAEKIFNAQSSLGSRLKRVYAAETRAETDEISFTQFLSATEDIDASEAIMNYQMELLTLQASLEAGARLLRPRLIDFLG